MAADPAIVLADLRAQLAAASADDASRRVTCPTCRANTRDLPRHEALHGTQEPTMPGAYNHFISPGQRDTWCAAIESFGLSPDDVSMSEAAIIPRITRHENGTATIEVDLMTRDEHGHVMVEAGTNELVLRRVTVTRPLTDAIAAAVDGA